MVDSDVRRRGVSNQRVLDAMGTVPRHLFVPPEQASRAYNDEPLPIGEGQTISQPYIVARMAELAGLSPGDRVLEVGAGCGYAAAVMAEVAREVVAVEIRPELAEAARRRLSDLGYDNVQIVTGDGVEVAAKKGPFDVISVPAAGDSIPPALEDNLSIGGRLVMPIGNRSRQHLWVSSRGDDGAIHRKQHEAVAFVPLVGGD